MDLCVYSVLIMVSPRTRELIGIYVYCKVSAERYSCISSQARTEVGDSQSSVLLLGH